MRTPSGLTFRRTHRNVWMAKATTSLLCVCRIDQVRSILVIADRNLSHNCKKKQARTANLPTQANLHSQSVTMSRYNLALLLLLAASSEAFLPAQHHQQKSVAFRPRSLVASAATENKEGEAAFVPLETAADENDEETLEKVEMFGKGAAKVRRKGGGARCVV